MTYGRGSGLDAGEGVPPAEGLEALQSAALEPLLGLLAEHFLNSLPADYAATLRPWLATAEGRATFSRIWPSRVGEYLEALKLLHAERPPI